jgi:hypothetical protein
VTHGQGRMKPFFRSCFILISLAFAAAGHAQSTQGPVSLDALAPKTAAFAATMNVACGVPQKTGCAIALPKISAYSTQQGLTLVPVSSGGSLASAQIGVCPGIVPAAIGTADSFDAVARLPQCKSSFKIIGQPLYPTFGYLIVSSANAAASLDDLVNNVAANTSLTISDGKLGSGGQITFSNMLATNPSYKRVISEDDDDTAASLAKVLSRAIDGYFVMDSPGSPLIAKVMNQLDASGKPAFKILDVRPGDAFYALQGVDGQHLYQEVTINPGVMGFGAVKTVSSNGEIIVNTSWANNPANAQAIAILIEAANRAEASILAGSHSPSDWTGQVSASQ